MVRALNCARNGGKEKKAGVLKCHITQHGNYAHDMRCVSPHHHRPLSMCRTGPQPSTCAQNMHEMYTGMSLYSFPRVGDATLINFFSLSCYAERHHPSGCFCYCPYRLLFVVPAPLKLRQLHFQGAAMTPCDISVKWNPFIFLCVSVCMCVSMLHLTWKVSLVSLLYFPNPVKSNSQNVSSHMVQGLKLSSYF